MISLQDVIEVSLIEITVILTTMTKTYLIVYVILTPKEEGEVVHSTEENLTGVKIQILMILT